MQIKAGAIHVLIPAAGRSLRFGGNKLLERIDGRSLIQRVTASAIAFADDRVTVVVGADAQRITAELRGLPVRIVANPDYQSGLGSSIRAGIATAPANCEAVLILLADQVAVTGAELRELADRWSEQPGHIVCASYSGAVGAPAIFPRSMFGELAALDGPDGARSVIRTRLSCVQAVPLPSAAVDIDTAADLAGYAGSSTDAGR